MDPAPRKVELVIEGSPSSPRYSETVALLDRSGLSYRIGDAAAPEG